VYLNNKKCKRRYELTIYYFIINNHCIWDYLQTYFRFLRIYISDGFGKPEEKNKKGGLGMANVAYDNDRVTCVLDFGTDAQGKEVSKRYSLGNIAKDGSDDNVLSIATAINSIVSGQGVIDVIRRKTSIISQ
jgi:hypothetical protein